MKADGFLKLWSFRQTPGVSTVIKPGWEPTMVRLEILALDGETFPDTLVFIVWYLKIKIHPSLMHPSQPQSLEVLTKFHCYLYKEDPRPLITLGAV